MGRIVAVIINLFRHHKSKLLTLLVSSIFFLLMIFPYGDLLETLTDQVTQASQQTVYFESRELDLEVFPLPGLVFEDVLTEVVQPPLQVKASRLAIRPGILSLIRLRPSIRAALSGFAKGDMDFGVSVRDKSDEKWTMDVDVAPRKISLESLLNGLPLPISLSGELSGELRSSIECAMGGAPQCQLAIPARGLIDVTIQDFKSPGGGALGLPPMGFQVFQLKGQITDGKLLINEGVLGQSTDPISGTIHGDVEVTSLPGMGLSFGAYRLNMDIQMNPETERNLAVIAVYLKQFRLGGPSDAGRYRFSVVGSPTQGMPTFGPYSQAQ